MRSINLQSFLLISLIVSELCPGQLQNVKMNKGQLLQNLAMRSSSFCALHISLLRSIYLQSFMLLSLVLLELFPRPDFLKGVIIKKFGKTELCFFVLHFNSMRSIYQQSFLLIYLIILM
jgi:hypothetical protein